ncbi:hypothetical protein [Edaphocola aurantiacus]|uniref:hypothetical protein n=1 Tax=Edaphocola aurantiacus TaxID=2601682 RepID=UPI001C94A92E|nr:hypothetical protein [Edaphocola aurantiacus]
MKKIIPFLLIALSLAFTTAKAQQGTEAFINDIAVHASANFLSIAGAKTGMSANGADTYYQSKLKPPVGTAQIVANKNLEGLFTWIIPMAQSKQIQLDAGQLMKAIVAQDSIFYYLQEDTDELGNKATILYEEDGFEGAPIMSVLNRTDKKNAANSQCIITIYGTGPLGDAYLTHNYTTDLAAMVKHAERGFKDILSGTIKTEDGVTYYRSSMYPKTGEITIGLEQSSGTHWLAWKAPLVLSKKLQADAEAYLKSQYGNNPFYEIKTSQDAATGMKITSVTMLTFPVFEIASVQNSKDNAPAANQFIIMVYETSETK